MVPDGSVPDRRPAARGALVSAAAHGLVLAFALLAARGEAPSAGADAIFRPDATPLVWIPTAAPPGGGGAGGGDRQATPLRRASSPGRDAVTVPVARPVTAGPAAPPPQEPVQALALSAQPLASGLTTLAGAVSASLPDAGGRGAGDGPGVDGQDGRAIGAGRGPGDGSGTGGERGNEGPPGNGVSWPRLVRDVRPQYTAEAMRARVSGSVGLSCVVDRDGSVRDCRVTRSLDTLYGLDAEALRVVRQWRFEPARRAGEPVPVRVTIELAFSMR